MSHEHAGAGDPPGPLIFAAAIALLLGIHLIFLVTGMTPVLDGRLPDPDSYMRLLRVAHLYQTGDWFDGSLPRSNWPYGEQQNWTRPADVLLLSGALALKPLLGFDRALFWWGSVTAPLLHMAAVLALLWAAAPLLPPSRRLLAVLALLVQVPLWLYGIFGRTDHHMLIVLVFVLALGGAVRMMTGPTRREALLAGAAAGFGLWLSLEFLVLLAVIFAALTLTWIRSGATRARDNLWLAAGVTLVVLLAVVTERAPAAWLAEVYDRISVVHLLMAALALAFWSAVVVVERFGGAGRTPLARLCIAAAGAACAAAVMLAVYPKFFLGPFVDYSSEVWPISTEITKEFQPLVPKNLASLGSVLLHLGPALVAVPYLCVKTLAGRGANLWAGWLPVALGLLAYLPLCLVMRRFSPYAAILLALVLADLAGLLLDRLAGARGLFRRVLTLLMVAAILLAPLALTGLVMQQSAAGPRPAAATPGCPLDRLIAELNRPDGLGRSPLAVLWTPNHGPRILYETPHAVIATLYARNARGQLDAYAIYTATDWDIARDLAAERGVGLIVTCVATATFGERSGDPGTLDTALRQGEFPSWLEPVALGPAAGRYFRVYRVLASEP